MYARRFVVFGIDAVVADMRISQRDYLAAIRGIGEDFLIARHRRVEHDFTDTAAICPDTLTMKNSAIGQS